MWEGMRRAGVNQKSGTPKDAQICSQRVGHSGMRSARTHGGGFAALLDLWPRLRRVWTIHERGFAAFARPADSAGGIPGMTAIVGLWLSANTGSDCH